MDFPRVKIGVGEKPKEYDLADYVLGHFTKEEQAIFAERFDEVYDAVQLIVMVLFRSLWQQILLRSLPLPVSLPF